MARSRLVLLGMIDFKRSFKNLYHVEPNMHYVNARFEPEEYVAGSVMLQVDTLEMTYRGKDHSARRLHHRIFGEEQEW